MHIIRWMCVLSLKEKNTELKELLVSQLVSLMIRNGIVRLF